MTCPRCQTSVDVRRRRRFWEGPDAIEARAAAGRVAAAFAQGLDPADGSADGPEQALIDRRPAVRHDTPMDAAAAKGRQHTNKSARAEEVALWMTRLVGDVAHDDLVAALQRSGLDFDRAEREVTRMLAADVIFEPRAGHYRHLDP